MENYTYKEFEQKIVNRKADINESIPLEWLESANYSRLLDNKYRAIIPQGFHKEMANIINSPEVIEKLSNITSRFNESRSRLIDYTALLYTIYILKGNKRNKDDGASFIHTSEIEYKRFNVFSIAVGKNIYKETLGYGINLRNTKQLIDILTTPRNVNGEMRQLLYITKNEYGQTYVGWDTHFVKRRNVELLLDRPGIVKGEYRHAERIWKRMGCHKVLKRSYENWLKLDKPNEEQIDKTLSDNLGKTVKGCLIVDENTEKTKENKEKCKWIEDIKETTMRYNNNSTPYFFSSNVLGQNRHYGPYHMLPSMTRKLYTYNGEKLVWFDVASMHPTILLTDYKRKWATETESKLIDRILDSGNPRKTLYTIAQKIGLDVGDERAFKKENLSYYNQTAKIARHYKVHKLYQAILPGFAKWLEGAKVMTDRKFGGNKCVSRYLLTIEAKIIEAALIECWSNDIFCLGAHDGIDCESTQKEKVFSILRKHLIIAGYEKATVTED